MSESLHRRVCHAVRGEIARYAYGAHVHIDMFHGCVFCGVISRSKRCSPNGSPCTGRNSAVGAMEEPGREGGD